MKFKSEDCTSHSRTFYDSFLNQASEDLGVYFGMSVLQGSPLNMKLQSLHNAAPSMPKWPDTSKNS